MSKIWKLGVSGILALGFAGILMFAGCGDDNNTPTQTTSTGSIATTSGTVAAGTTVPPPAGVTSMTFTAPSTLTDSAGTPVTGAITTTVVKSTSVSSLPVAAPAGTSLAVLLDIDMSQGTTKVTNFTTPMTVIVAVPAGVTSVDVYSYNGTAWVLEQPGVAVSGGNATISITHLSIWACFSKIIATPTPAPTATPGVTPTPAPTVTPTPTVAPTPTPVPVVNAAALYTAQCAGCHSLGTVDPAGSPNLSGITTVPSRFTAGVATNHNGASITLSAAEIAALSAYVLAN